MPIHIEANPVIMKIWHWSIRDKVWWKYFEKSSWVENLQFKAQDDFWVMLQLFFSAHICKSLAKYLYIKDTRMPSKLQIVTWLRLIYGLRYSVHHVILMYILALQRPNEKRSTREVPETQMMKSERHERLEIIMILVKRSRQYRAGKHQIWMKL